MFQDDKEDLHLAIVMGFSLGIGLAATDVGSRPAFSLQYQSKPFLNNICGLSLSFFLFPLKTPDFCSQVGGIHFGLLRVSVYPELQFFDPKETLLLNSLFPNNYGLANPNMGSCEPLIYSWLVSTIRLGLSNFVSQITVYKDEEMTADWKSKTLFRIDVAMRRSPHEWKCLASTDVIVPFSFS